MIIFLLGEDRAYLSWLAHHRNGFVVDWLRKPTGKRPMLHRATCATIRSSPAKNTHWTTGRHVKVCALGLDELVQWARDESGAAPDPCEVCQPTDDEASAPVGDRHLTKLGKEIVEYVVEAAVIHLDGHDQDYRLTVGDIARYLDKTAKQVTSGLTRLADDGYIRLSGKPERDGGLPDDCRVLPTSDALRTLPAFTAMPRPAIEAELEGLSDEE